LHLEEVERMRKSRMRKGPEAEETSSPWRKLAV
jgi:hypothetical protein